MSSESKESGRNDRNSPRQSFKPIQVWYKPSTTCRTEEEGNVEESAAASDRESTAGENQHKGQNRLYWKMTFTRGWTAPEPLTLHYPNAKIRLFTLLLSPQQQLLFSLVRTAIGTRILEFLLSMGAWLSMNPPLLQHWTQLMWPMKLF